MPDQFHPGIRSLSPPHQYGVFGLVLNNGAVINNYRTFLAEPHPSQSAWTSEGATGTFNNYGTVIGKSGNETRFYVPFNNYGTVQVQAGTLRVYAGTHTGAFLGERDTVLSVDGTCAATSSIVSAGTVYMGGTFSGTYNVTGTTRVRSGTLDFTDDDDPLTPPSLNIVSLGEKLILDFSGLVKFHDTPITVPNIELEAVYSPGGISGANITVTNSMKWTAGTMSGGGVTTIAPGATLEVSGWSPRGHTSWYLDGQRIDNYGTATVTAGPVDPGFVIERTFNLENGAAINNYASLTAATTYFSESQRAQLRFSESGTLPTALNNFGTFVKTGEGPTYFNGVEFNSTGPVDVQGGTLLLLGGGSADGTSERSADFVVASGTGLTIAGNWDFGANSSISGAGAVATGYWNLPPGSTTFAGTYNITGSTSAGGYVTFSTPVVNLGTKFSTRGDSYDSIDFQGGLLHTQFDSLEITSADVNFHEANLTAVHVALGVGTSTLICGDLTVSGDMVWTSGTMAGAGVTTIAPGATLDVLLLSNATLNARTLNNEGTVNWTGKATSKYYLKDGAVFNNLPGAVVNFATDASHKDYIVAAGTLPVQFNNAGTIRKSTKNTEMWFCNDSQKDWVRFSNTGLVDVQQGSLYLAMAPYQETPEGPTITHTGTFNVGDARLVLWDGWGAYVLDNNTLIQTTEPGKGTVELHGPATMAGTYDVTGTTLVSPASPSGVFDFSGTMLNVGHTLKILNANADFHSTPISTTTLSVSGNATFIAGDVTTTELQWSGNATMGGAGTTTVLPGGTITGYGMPGIASGVVLDGRTLNNYGSATWYDKTIELRNGAQFNNFGTFTALAATYAPAIFGTGTFDNSGQFFSAGTTYAPTVKVPFTNSGLVVVQSGVLEFTAAYTQTAGQTSLHGGNIKTATPLDIQGGSLTGSGTITGSVTNRGLAAPDVAGGDFGQIRITGGYTQPATADAGGPYTVDEGGTVQLEASTSGESGAMDIQIGGLQPGSEFDQLSVAGTVKLGGRLIVSLLGGYAPGIGETFAIVTNDGTDAVQGAFADLPEGAILTTDDGYKFRITYRGVGGQDGVANDVVLTAVDPSDPGLPLVEPNYVWDLDGDGVFGEPGEDAARGDEIGQNPIFSAAGLDGPWTWPVAVRFTDATGAVSTGLGVVNVRNAPPTADAGGPYEVAVGGSVVLAGSGTDPAGDADPLTFLWDLDGDGIFGEIGADARQGDELGATPTFVAAGLPGGSVWTVQLKVRDDDGGESAVAEAVVDVIYLPDLVISSPDITFTPLNPEAGQLVTIRAKVTNQGLREATDIPVHFFAFDTLKGTATIASLAPGETAEVTLGTGFALEGHYLIKVKVDPDNTVAEVDEENNEASQVLQVGSPTVPGAVIVVDAPAATVYRGRPGSVSGRADYDFSTMPGTQDFPVQGARVTVTVIDPTTSDVLGVFTGAHTDVNGNFSQAILAPAVNGTYQLLVEVTDETATTQVESTLKVVEPPLPPLPGPPVPSGPVTDAFVFSDLIYLDNTNPQLGEEIEILAYVGYVGPEAAADVPVNVTDWFPVGGVLVPFEVGTRDVDLQASVGVPVYAEVRVPWINTAEGAHIIQVAVHPAFEQNRLNDAATRLIYVGTPPEFLTIEKTVDLAVDADENGIPTPGDTLIYTISYVNSADGVELTGANIMDYYADDFLEAPFDLSPDGTVAEGTIRWELGTLVAGASGEVTYSATIRSAAELGGGGTVEVVNVAMLDTDQTAPIGTTATIQVVVNIAPVAVDDSFTTEEDATLTVPSRGVLANDTDANGDELTALLVTGPSHGTLELSPDGSFTYTPEANFFGVDTFRYKAHDGQADSNEAVVTITVTEVNDAPVVDQEHSLTVTEDGRAEITLTGSDVETAVGDLSFTITSLPELGALMLRNDDGTLVIVQLDQTFIGPPTLIYEPGAAWEGEGSDSFSFKVSDGELESEPAAVAMSIVKAVADGAVTIDDAGIVRIGGTSAGDVISVAHTADGQRLRVQINSNVFDTISLAAVQEVRAWGRAGNDRVELVDLAILSLLHGGAGNDTLIGGAASDMIFGGDGDDTITGSAGNDFLVGGDGSDRIVGSAGHDVLVAGDPAYRFTRDALWAVLADWMAGRVDDNGTDDDVLDETVIADEDLDMLTGSSGADWFIISQGDKITDFKTLNKDGDLITVV